ncbi:MAG: BamA/TamA family outer membrane protein [Prevotella sp.]
MKKTIYIFYIGIAATICGCNTTKFIGDNDCLLEEVEIKADTKGFDAAQLEPYIRQRANSKWFSLFKIPLGTYSLAGNDTTKWINKTLRKIGEEPVLFDTLQARLSCEDLKAAMQNMGYMNARVELQTRKKGKRLKACYILHPGEPFIIQSFGYNIQDSLVREILEPYITEQKPRQFTVSALDNERKRLTTILNDNGFYRFNKDFITYTADSVEGDRNIDVTLHLHKFKANNDALATTHPRYRIGRVNFMPGDSTGLHIRPSVLYNTSAIVEGEYFSAAKLQRTYNAFGKLGAVRYTDISFEEIPDSNILDCNIKISNYKPNTISFQPEGTNTSGDFGAAASLTYQNRNLFKGSELLSIQLRGAFEAITGLEGYDNHDYEEYNVEAKLLFPRFLAPFLSKTFKRRSSATSEVNLSWNMQNRPEFHRKVFSAGWRYRWTNTTRRTTYNLDLIDLNYVYMPWISKTFKEDYLDDYSNRNAILRYNYEDLFIMKIGFGLTYKDATQSLRANVETAGNILKFMAPMTGMERNEDGQYKLFNIAFAQYAKFDFDYSKTFVLDSKNRIVLHSGIGIAYPYGNSNILPFEKRYFSGGANSVRGWSVRELGPGSFKGSDGRIDFINQTGDMKIDLNAELRTHLFWKFDGAAFIDAGNIWTLRAYEEQPGGQFKLDEFYKQIAMSYGLGLRLNFDYFIIRMDMGMKAVNPSYTNSKQHYPITNHDMGRDFTFHFAVGMPF